MYAKIVFLFAIIISYKLHISLVNVYKTLRVEKLFPSSVNVYDIVYFIGAHIVRAILVLITNCKSSSIESGT